MFIACRLACGHADPVSAWVSAHALRTTGLPSPIQGCTLPIANQAPATMAIISTT
jgi:hypothetical protein